MGREDFEFESAARKFVTECLPFLSREWREHTLAPLLTALLKKTVKEHTAETSNTALRLAAKQTIELVQHVRQYLPHEARKCRCRELDDGEHRVQPICHLCALGSIEVATKKALEGGVS